jgi:hypothetical protein
LKLSIFTTYILDGANFNPAFVFLRQNQIMAAANPFDPQFKEYFQKREQERKTRKMLLKNSKYAGLKLI